MVPLGDVVCAYRWYDKYEFPRGVQTLHTNLRQGGETQPVFFLLIMDWKKLANIIAGQVNRSYFVPPHVLIMSIRSQDPDLYDDLLTETNNQMAGQAYPLIACIADKYRSLIKTYAKTFSCSIHDVTTEATRIHFTKAF